MSAQEIQIRRATPMDNELLARLAAETFPGNFVGTTEPSAMVSYIERSFNPEQQAKEITEPGSVFFIAQAGANPVGYARVRDQDAPSGVDAPTVEIHRVYVVRDHWGKGAGRALVNACIDEAAARGCATIWLGAWSENPRAVGFYGSLGFEAVGKQKFKLGEELHDDLILRLQLR